MALGGFCGIYFGSYILSLHVEGFIRPKGSVINFDVHLSYGEFTIECEKVFPIFIFIMLHFTFYMYL